MAVPDYFKTDPDWAAYAEKHGYPLPPNKSMHSPPLERLDASKWDFQGIRANLAESERTWANEHPEASRGYESTLTNIKVRDGSSCSVKVSWPLAKRIEGNSGSEGSKLLPVVFVTHGGGWIQGTHTTEEAWLLWPFLQKFDLVIVSVEYRMAPEHKFPTWIEDSWDVLQRLLSDTSLFLPLNSSVQIDLERLYLAGSSAGGCISAVLSHMCRDNNIHVSGVILNVPVICDYRHMPVDSSQSRDKPPSSYEQCMYSDSRSMMALWDMVCPIVESQPHPFASPLLSDVVGLPPHIIFVAGQDPLRDEGIAYARKLQDGSVVVTLKIYPGVPHNFAQYWELKATQHFWEDVNESFNDLLNTSVSVANT